MINPFTSEQRRIQEAYASHIYEKVNPDIYAVCTLKQGIFTDNIYIPGDPARYAAEAKRFIRRLSRRVYGRNYARTKKEIPAAVTLENHKGEQRFHLNVMLRKPDWMSHNRFETAFTLEWMKMPWGRDDMKFGVRYADCVRYSLKEGSDSLVYLTR